MLRVLYWSLACCLATCCLADTIKLQMVPRKVYLATDGVPPRWRVMLVAINQGADSVCLEEIRVTSNAATGPVVAVHHGDALKNVVRGAIEASPGRPIIMYVTDDGGIVGVVETIEIRATFRTAGGELIHAERFFPLRPRTTTYLRFPLQGRWITANSREAQHGAGIAFAMDFMTPEDLDLVDKPPARPLAAFTGWNRPVFSPFRGQVVACRRDRPDCAPSPEKASFAGKAVSDISEFVGNYIVIATPYDSYLFLAHFQQDSVCVKVGDEVRAGQLVGRVGNSGNSNGPHLHLELLDDAPDLTKLASSRFAQSGLPFGFRDLCAELNDKLVRVQRCVPTANQILHDR